VICLSVIDVTAARELIAANPDVLLVDVRTPGEFAGVHIPGAVNLPLDQVEAHLERIVKDAGGRMILICRSGARAERCRRTLQTAGVHDALVLEGGMNAWIAAGGPVVRGRPRWDLERQVRLTAGGIVAASIAASLLWPPARFVAGLVGVGLVVAAITDTCALGMLLAKLPYNRPAQAGGGHEGLERPAGAER